MNNLNYRVKAHIFGKTRVIGESDFLTPIISYCENGSSYHTNTTFHIEKYIHGEYVEICNFLNGIEVPF